jgi:hypothetical protein
MLILVRPAPQLEVPPSDDEQMELLSPIAQKQASSMLPRGSPSPELGSEPTEDRPVQEEPSDLEHARDRDIIPPCAAKQRKPKPQKTTKAKGGYKIGKQVSNNYVSYKIRSRGRRGRGRFSRR